MRNWFGNKNIMLKDTTSTSSHVLEARGSVEALMLLSCEDGIATAPSMREEKSTFSILSGFSLKRMAARTDKSLRDCQKDCR